MLHETDTLPNGLLEANATELKQLLGSPTLIHLPGEKPEPLFICTLLHGNETTGFYAIQRLLKQYQNKPLPRAVSIFIGNVDAAAVAQRRLDQQPDYNRIWPGTHHDDCAETDMMKTIANIMNKRKTFASIVVNINAGKCSAFVHDIGNGSHHVCFRAVIMMSARPDAIVVRLVIESAQANRRSFNIANEQRDGARQ